MEDQTGGSVGKGGEEGRVEETYWKGRGEDQTGGEVGSC